MKLNLEYTGASDPGVILHFADADDFSLKGIETIRDGLEGVMGYYEGQYNQLKEVLSQAEGYHKAHRELRAIKALNVDPQGFQEIDMPFIMDDEDFDDLFPAVPEAETLDPMKPELPEWELCPICRKRVIKTGDKACEVCQ